MIQNKRFLLAGLGNPGPSYRMTRHNAGFIVADLVAAGREWIERDGVALYCRFETDSAEIILLKPLTFMNLSGSALKFALEKFNIQPSLCVIAYDDFHLPFGALRVRGSGSAAGHNGMQSIIDTLGTRDIPRLRLGIGPVPAGMDPAVFVLGKFAKDERQTIEETAGRAAEAFTDIVNSGLQAAMMRYNTKEKAADE